MNNDRRRNNAGAKRGTSEGIRIERNLGCSINYCDTSE